MHQDTQHQPNKSDKTGRAGTTWHTIKTRLHSITTTAGYVISNSNAETATHPSLHSDRSTATTTETATCVAARKGVTMAARIVSAAEE